MDLKSDKIRKRLEKVWEAPKFAELFEKSPHKPHIIKKGTLIFNENDPLGRLYYIKEGFIKLHRTSEDGRDATSYLLGKGQVMGLRAFLSEDESAKHNAETLTDVTVITMSRKEYLEHLIAQPDKVVDLLHAFIERLNYSERKLEGFMLTDATARVSTFISDCARRFGIRKDGKVTFPLKLTHQLIADFVGSFRETVSVSLKHLEDEGVIQNNKSIITVLDLKKLHSFASRSKHICNPQK